MKKLRESFSIENNPEQMIEQRMNIWTQTETYTTI